MPWARVKPGQQHHPALNHLVVQPSMLENAVHIDEWLDQKGRVQEANLFPWVKTIGPLSQGIKSRIEFGQSLRLIKAILD